MAKPHARVVSEVCSLCGLDWKRHSKEPTAEGCVKLLLDEVRSLHAQIATRPLIVNNPVPMPYYPRTYYPLWYTSGASASTSLGSTWQTSTTSGSINPHALTIRSGLAR